jgi:hypothetical protein
LIAPLTFFDGPPYVAVVDIPPSNGVKVPPLQIRGPDLNPPPGNSVVTLYGEPDEQLVADKRQAALGVDANARVLYVVANTAQQLVRMSVLWQIGGPQPVKLRPPQDGLPPIIYGVSDSDAIEQRRNEANAQAWGTPPCYLIADNAGQVVWLQWVWVNGPYP